MSHMNVEVDIPDLWPLRTIYEASKQLQEICSFRQLERWAEPKRKNGFPEPTRIGRYNLYDPKEVIQYTVLWSRTNEHRPKHNMNGAKDA